MTTDQQTSLEPLLYRVHSIYAAVKVLLQCFIQFRGGGKKGGKKKKRIKVQMYCFVWSKTKKEKEMKNKLDKK